MKKFYIILSFISCTAYAQTDSISQAADTLLNNAQIKLDSIEHAFGAQTDSIRKAYSKRKEKITSLKSTYQTSIDSLHKLNLPTDRYTHKVDSLDRQLAGLQKNTANKIDSLKSGFTEKINALKLPKQADGKISKLTSAMDKVSLPAIDSEVAGKFGLDKFNTPDIPGTSLPDLPGTKLPDVNTPGGINTNIPDTKLPSKGIDTGKIGDVTGQVGDLKKQLQDATASPEGLGKTVESKAKDLEAVKSLPGQNLPEQPGLPGGMPSTGDEAKEQLLQQAKKEAVNHFAGKEAALTSAMEKMSKYKQKYSSVSSLKDLPEKKPNEMKSKKFAERIVPALTLQFQSLHDVMLDVNASAGFRFTSHFTAGVGWNRRWAYNIPDREFNPDARVYGIRSYGEYTLKKGFGFRMDIETMNTPIRKLNNVLTETMYRDWVWSVLTGIKQRYTIVKTLRGNAQIMYNLFDRHHRSPYTDRLNFRVGFEYTIKHGKKDKTKV